MSSAEILAKLDEVLAKKEDFHDSARNYLAEAARFDIAAGNLLRSKHAPQIRAALVQASEGWQSFETAPEEGEFLVYMPNERQKIQAARRTKKLMVIGGSFDFDLTKATLWRPNPALPEGEQG